MGGPARGVLQIELMSEMDEDDLEMPFCIGNKGTIIRWKVEYGI